jgi:hypothetical protein
MRHPRGKTVGTLRAGWAIGVNYGAKTDSLRRLDEWAFLQ